MCCWVVILLSFASTFRYDIACTSQPLFIFYFLEDCVLIQATYMPCWRLCTLTSHVCPVEDCVLLKATYAMLKTVCSYNPCMPCWRLCTLTSHVYPVEDCVLIQAMYALLKTVYSYKPCMPCWEINFINAWHSLTLLFTVPSTTMYESGESLSPFTMG